MQPRTATVTPAQWATALTAAVDYPTYAAQVEALVAAGLTSGPVQTADLAEYTRLNHFRMKRLFEHTVLDEALLTAVAQVHTPQYWVVLTEAWCGDAAQNVPVIARMAALSPHIQLRLLYRDAHLPVMDAYLTNGGRSIPKLIALRQADFAELGTWGPRPAEVQALMFHMKAHPNGRTKADMMREIVAWYNQDKTRSLQAEFTALLPQWA